MPSGHHKIGMVQFQRQDIRFFKDGTILLHNTPLPQLRAADGVRIYINNQKNGQRGSSTIYHMARPGAFCPVKALAARTHHLYCLAPTDDSLPISFVAPGTHILSAQITLAIHESVVLSGLLNLGYSVTGVSAHSLWASGAMALRLNNAGKDLIKKLGHWSSLTWLIYIHAQTSSLTAGLSKQMVVHHVFYNVGS